MRLVEEVHKCVEKVIMEGDLIIDATIGNGYDTEFLAKLGACVIGFDIQEEAIVNTGKRLKDAGILERVLLYKEGHECMIEFVPKDWIGNVQVVMFNLGYLPGGDKTCITRRETTLLGLESAYNLLKEGGYLSVVLYPDHEGGAEEARAVKEWILGMDGEVHHVRPAKSGPEWYWVKKVLDNEEICVRLGVREKNT